MIINCDKYTKIFHSNINLGNLKRRSKRNGKLRFTIMVQEQNTLPSLRLRCRKGDALYT